MEKNNRRGFLKDFGQKLAAGMLFPKSINPEFWPVEPGQEPELGLLENYSLSVNEERLRARSIVESYEGNIFSGIKNLSKDQVLEDFDLYFLMYKAAEIEYGVPWFLLWIIHIHETTVSRDSSNSGHSGAMQLNYDNYYKPEIQRAGEGWEALEELYQRWRKTDGWETSDWEEIMRAAVYIRLKFPGVDDPNADEEGLLRIVEYGYSHPIHGKARVVKYRELKELFRVD